MFKYSLGQEVKIDVSGELGRVIGRTDYESGESQYLIRYKAADGRAVEAWWAESALAES